MDPEDEKKTRQFDESIMNSMDRPKLYFIPEEVIEQCGEVYDKFKE